MSQDALNKVEQGLLDAISKAVSENKPLEAEQWTHAYVQFRQGLGIKRQDS